jgi:hypothetical protein
MKTIIIFIFYFISITAFAQSKKTQIENLNSKVDSLTQLIEKERLITKNEIRTLKDQIEKIKIDYTALSEKNDFLSNQLKDQLSFGSNLLFKNDSLLNEIKKLKNTTTKHTLENKEKILRFIDDINSYCRIPKSNFFEIADDKTKTGKVVSFNFSNLSLEYLAEFNVENYNQINLNLYLDTNNKLTYGKLERSCCPADEQEIVFFFLGTNFILFDHSAGQFGGTLTTYKNGEVLSDAFYSLPEESTESISLFGGF